MVKVINTLMILQDNFVNMEYLPDALRGHKILRTGQQSTGRRVKEISSRALERKVWVLKVKELEHQTIIFESSPAYVLVCAVFGVGFAYLLYRFETSMDKDMEQNPCLRLAQCWHFFSCSFFWDQS